MKKELKNIYSILFYITLSLQEFLCIKFLHPNNFLQS